MKRITAIFCTSFLIPFLILACDKAPQSVEQDNDDKKDTTQVAPPADTSDVNDPPGDNPVDPPGDDPVDPGDDPVDPGEGDDTEKLAVTIIGDSYSTFEGYSNRDVNGRANGFAVYYPQEAKDVKKVEQTWWHKICSQPGYRLEMNSSFSGGTVCNTGYGGYDVTDAPSAVVTRVTKSYLGNPDIIIIFGGTNDSWAGSPMGFYIFENWTKSDLKCFRPAFSYLLATLQATYPEARIYNISNTRTEGISKDVTVSMQYICKYHKVPNIILTDIEKFDSHPNVKGMEAIFNQVFPVITGEKEPAPEPEGDPNTTNIDEWEKDEPVRM